MANKPEKEKKHFFRNFKAELKKVIWPTPKQVVNNTIAVATIVLVTAAIVLVLDLTFEGINTFGINRLKTVLNNEASNEVSEENTVDTEEENIDTDDTENPEEVENTTPEDEEEN